MTDQFITEVLLYLLVAFIAFMIGVYIIRAIFNIPSFLRYQKAQIRLLEEIAKKQGVDNTKVQSIISESIGWDAPLQQNAPSTTQVQ